MPRLRSAASTAQQTGPHCQRVSSIEWTQMTQARRVCLDEHMLDLAVRYREKQGRNHASLAEGDDCRLTVQVAFVPLQACFSLARNRGKEDGDLLRAVEWFGKVANAREADTCGTAIGDHHCVIRQQLDQLVHLAGAHGLQESAQEASMLFGRRSEDSPCRRHVPPGAPQKLSAGGLTLPEQRRDLPVIEIENVVEEEGGALRMRQPLKRDDE